MAETLTTLQLAQRIAVAVLSAARPQGAEPYRDAPTQAVLRVLDETGHWFCRVGETSDGETTQTPLEPVQQEMFG